MKTNINNFIRYVGLIVLLALLSGCLPWPHSTPRAAEVQGRVLDSRTHIPIQGAAVFLVQSPHHTTYTDENGYFTLKATQNFHFGIVPPEGDWPDRKDNYVQITHTNYFPYGFDDYAGGEMGNILLRPKP